MTQGLLDFFVLEAGEYTEQLDGALAKASGNVPDLDVFTRNARALRGSATMARVDGIAKVATGLERLGRGLRDGSLKWSPQLRSAIVAAIDDVKILIHAARTWGKAEEHRAAARSAELDTLAPAFSRRSVVTPILAIGSVLWMAAETADIAAGLRRWADQGGPFESLGETVRRVRGLRGIAALADFPPLKDVIDTIDDTAKALELGAIPSDSHRYLFRTAADVLREASDAVQNSRQPNVVSPAVATFNAAASLLIAGSDDKDYVVPIAALFPDGSGHHVVHAAPNPPTTPNQRFRMEVVSQAEHLRRLVGDARRAADGPSKQRLANALKSGTLALQRAAESFGERATARTAQGLVQAAAAMEAPALDALEQLAISLSTGRVSEPTPRMTTPVAAPPSGTDAFRIPTPPVAQTPTMPPPVVPPPAVQTPRLTPRLTPSSMPTPYAPIAAVSRATGAFMLPAPTGVSLTQALESGLTGLARLNAEPMAEPANVDEDDGVVPIQDLLYRGKSALARAIVVSESIKGGATPPEQDALAELLDLLELATSE